MASFPIDINPSISTLVENAQRTNPMLGKKTIEHKKKKVKSGERMRAAADGDSTQLSDEMLGDMDPDQRKEKDHLSEFKKRMQEWITEQEDEEKDDNLQDEDKEQSKDEEPPEEVFEDQEATAEKKDHTEALTPVEEDSSRISDELREEPKEKEDNKLEQDSPVSVSMDEKSFADKSADIELTETPDLSDSSFQDNAHIKTKEKVEDQTFSKVVTNYSQTDKGDFSQIEEDEEESSPIKKESEFISLLTYDDGFIIADAGKKTAKPGSYNDSQREKAKKSSKKEKSKPSLPSPLESRFKRVFLKLLVSQDLNPLSEKLCRQLKIFGIRVLETCADNSERILIIPSGGSLENYKEVLSREYSPSALKVKIGYFPLDKLMVICDDIINNDYPRFTPSVLYFAHLFDHSLGNVGFASENSPIVVSNYNSCKNKEEGHQFIDGYSAVSPVHYFAQTVEAFLTAPHGKLSSANTDYTARICSKEELYDLDRAMYSYIEYLFKQVNRGEELNLSQDDENNYGVI